MGLPADGSSRGSVASRPTRVMVFIWLCLSGWFPVGAGCSWWLSRREERRRSPEGLDLLCRGLARANAVRGPGGSSGFGKGGCVDVTSSEHDASMYPVAAEDEQMQPGEQRTFRMSRRGCWRGLRAAHCGVGLLAAVVALSRRLLAMARHRRGLDATEMGADGRSTDHAGARRVGVAPA